MKKNLFCFLLIAAVFSTCRTEDDAAPAKESTFIRYFGPEYNADAVMAIQAGQGFTLVSTVTRSLATGTNTQIKLTRTDLYGNFLWETNFPNSFDTPGGMEASSIIPLSAEENVDPGYLIIGDLIKDDGFRDLLLLFISPTGSMDELKTIPAPENSSLQGSAVHRDNAGNLFVLGNVPGKEQMYVAKLSGQDLTFKWQKFLPSSGSIDLNTKLYVNASNQDTTLLWGGSWLSTSTNKHDPVLLRIGPNSEVPQWGNQIGDQSVDEESADLCSAVGGWALTGKSVDTSGEENTFVTKVSNGAQPTVIFEKILDFFPAQNDYGNSICRANDGGLMVLGTVTTAEYGDDLFVTKLNDAGVSEWTSPSYFTYGSSDNQLAASIAPVSDGGYIVFGTNSFSDEKKLILIKLNRDGKL